MAPYIHIHICICICIYLDMSMYMYVYLCLDYATIIPTILVYEVMQDLYHR